MVTREDLQQYIGLVKELEAIEEEIKGLYYPISSPTSDKVGGNKSVVTPTSPTEQTVERITKLKAKKEKIQAKIKKIDDFIEGISDHYISAIYRYHYVQGYSWANTCYKIYGYYSADTVRSAANRYLKRKSSEF